MFDDLTSLVGVAEVVGVIVMAILYVRSRLPKETIDQQTKLIDALNKRINNLDNDNRELQKQHVENQRAIADLQGKVKAYKEFALQDIARSLKALENIPSEFQKITEASTNKIIEAVTNVQNQHVFNQTVDKEVVNNKE